MAQILLISDLQEVRNRWEAALLAKGHSCRVHSNGTKAWKSLLEETPDAIVSGLFVPDLDGVELLRRLRELQVGIPVIVLREDTSDRTHPLYEVASMLGAARTTPAWADAGDIQALVKEVLSETRTPTPPPPTTLFAPAERAPMEEVLRQAEALRGNDLFRSVLSSLKSLLLVVNEQRQIVFTNEHALSVAGVSEEDALGLRPGELVGCVHSHETPGGCGTTESCRSCGVVRAILGALQGHDTVQEARLTLESGSSLDLRVSARPLEFQGARLAVVRMEDVAAEQRRRVLERVFFHDVLNTAGGVQGLASLVGAASEDDREQLLAMLERTAKQLVREINAQRVLSAVENNEYTSEAWPRVIAEAVEDAASANRALAEERGVSIEVAGDLPEGVIVTDGTLLGRVLGNLTKNAVEASARGHTVTLSARGGSDTVTFVVHNPTTMPRDVELQVFQRSFSTKGTGRGLGTYAARLFTERYLGGTIEMTTSPEHGTTLAVSLPHAAPARARDD